MVSNPESDVFGLLFPVTLTERWQGKQDVYQT